MRCRVVNSLLSFRDTYGASDPGVSGTVRKKEQFVTFQNQTVTFPDSRGSRKFFEGWRGHTNLYRYIEEIPTVKWIMEITESHFISLLPLPRT